MAIEMNRVGISLVTLALMVCVGCGKADPVAQTEGPKTSESLAPEPTPTEIVSQFLDRVRRGGQDSYAGQLLTQTAQSELARIGRSVQPIGSPDASFVVTRSEPVPGDNGAMLVQSLWTEPNADGTKSSYEVVWALQHESVGWRISGLAMELGAGAEPMVINFEDGDRMAQLFAEEPETEVAVNPSQGIAEPAPITQ
jgi:hypothetical protein